ncbi:hypothetical protein PGT21_014583 [Puccinia graminis f. sp. tritici]|uniref:Uncharacterized protein n=1 Tax=Puccinia graminis f. sp. tritici TaxID=56615 RepID=A0A5B0LSP5_PUCGR|nr:hypothetical protein PGTUg99_014829 [Puccinia graminis f. sp. tritici]KAA1071665.1 hypothetical protein PGT21_014583 [Puccinia graminis f. sp. tritici]
MILGVLSASSGRQFVALPCTSGGQEHRLGPPPARQGFHAPAINLNINAEGNVKYPPLRTGRDIFQMSPFQLLSLPSRSLTEPIVCDHAVFRVAPPPCNDTTAVTKASPRSKNHIQASESGSSQGRYFDLPQEELKNSRRPGSKRRRRYRPHCLNLKIPPKL